MSATPTTPFRRVEKHFKNRAVKGQLPSLRKYPVVDLSRPALAEDDPLWRAGWWSPANDAEVTYKGTRPRLDKGKQRELGERPGEIPEQYKGLKRVRIEGGKIGYLVCEGCVLLPGYLNDSEQLSLFESCLARYTLPPNPLSLSTHYDLPPNLFELYQIRSEDLIQPLFDTLDTRYQDVIRGVIQEKHDRTASGEPSNPDLPRSIEDVLSRNKGWSGDLPTEGLQAKTAETLMADLRWANLGLVYKEYDLAPDAAIPFPSNLGIMCQNVIREIEWDDVYSRENQDRFKVEAWKSDYDTGIVNFYRTKDTLMGHVDRAELDPYRPLVSISLGHAAVFLLGTDTREIGPIPIILRSGDVIVMSGTGRQNYHGIPRVLEGTLPSHFSPSDTDNPTLAAAKRWIQTGRINISARQVFSPDERSCKDEHVS